MNIESSKLIRTCVLSLIIVFSVYILIKYLLPLSIPFILAFIISRIVRPISKKIRSINRRIDKPATAVILLFFLSIAFVLLRFLISLTIGQIESLIESLVDKITSEINPISVIVDKINSYSAYHPVLNKLLTAISDPSEDEGVIVDAINNLLSEAASFIAKTAGTILTELPSLIVSLFMTFSASFYMCLDRGETKAFISKFIPAPTMRSITNIKKIVFKAAAGYTKSYLLMMLIVFALSYLGLTLIGVEYALIKALGVAVVDLLPVLGAGTVLVPWAVVDLVLGNTTQAIGLLILLFVITIVRELFEPKIIGGYIGAPSLIVLVSVYIGMKVFGFTGMIMFPIITSVVFSAINESYNQKTPTEVGVKGS